MTSPSAPAGPPAGPAGPPAGPAALPSGPAGPPAGGLATPHAGRLPLRRPRAGRWIGGVCLAIAAHLGVDVRYVRVAMVLAIAAGGAGAILYGFLWLTVPSGDPVEASRAARPVHQSRLARFVGSKTTTLDTRELALGVVLIALAGLLVADRLGADIHVSWLVPLLIALAGAALAWSQLDAAERGRLITRAGGSTRVGAARLVGGLLLLLTGVVLFVGQDAPAGTVVRAGIAGVAVLAGAAVMAAPWWLRLGRELGDERAARAREAERADIAAHLHDSVLQTLALIRSRAGDADAVARLARAQERELRAWLYDDRPTPGTSLAAELRELVGAVEDGRVAKRREDGTAPTPVAIDLVVVGDCPPTVRTTALLKATREALVNAVAHGRPPISVYLEVTDDAVEVFVRDRGDGFRIEDVAPDRLGVRQSIVGRVTRQGGTAEVESRPGWGTEVRVRVPRTPHGEPPQAPPSAPAGAHGAGSATAPAATTATAPAATTATAPTVPSAATAAPVPSRATAVPTPQAPRSRRARRRAAKAARKDPS